MAREERLLPLPAELQRLPQTETAATYAPVYDSVPQGEQRSIYEYVAIIIKRKWLILAIVLVATVSTAIYMYRLPSIYQGQAQISIEPRRQKQAKDSININFGDDPSYRNTQLKLVQSPELMRQVVLQMGLYRNPTLLNEAAGPGLLGRVGTMFGSKKNDQNAASSLPVITQSDNNPTGSTPSLSPEENERADAYGKSLVSGLQVQADRDTYLVSLTYQHTNRDLAVAIPNAVAKVYIAQDIEREVQGSERQSRDNIKAIDELQSNINTLENQRIAGLKANDLPLIDGKSGNLTADRLTTLSSQWLAAEDELRKMRAEYESAVRAKASGGFNSIPAVRSDQSIMNAQGEAAKRANDVKRRLDTYDDQIAALETQRSDLLGRYTEEYKDVKQATAKIERLKAERVKVERASTAEVERESQQLRKSATEDVLGAMRAKYEAAAKREGELRQAYFTERAKANGQAQSEIKLGTLTQQIETNRKLLDSALQRQKELELAVNSSRPDNIKITNQSENAQLVGPQRARSIFIALLASLVGGIGLSFLLDYLDDSIKSSDDIGRHLGLPTLALIPYNSSANNGFGSKRLTTAGSADASVNALITLDDARSATAEAYRHLRTSLLFSSAGKPPQAILVTSSQPSEGKTTTAVNTAITLAQAGAEVVILDCDLRRPRLHHHFQLDNQHGLTNYLSGDNDAAQLVKPLERMPNLKVITSGPIPPNPAEMLGSNEMRTLIEYLRSNYKHVIIDSPPAISFTDATILSTLVDGVVIVAMAGRSSIHLIRNFKQRLSSVGTRVFGVVLNGIKRNSLDYGYGYYGYGYNYSYEDPDDATTSRLSEEE